MNSPLPFSKDEMLKILPIIISDLKHQFETEKRIRNNSNIRHDMYFHVIREMYSDTRFKKNEEVDGRGGLFIKGYVRDVWSYLEDAYNIIHETDFEIEFQDLINSIP